MNIGDKVICRSITPRAGSEALTLGSEYEVSLLIPSRDGDLMSVEGVDGEFYALDFEPKQNNQS